MILFWVHVCDFERDICSRIEKPLLLSYLDSPQRKLHLYSLPQMIYYLNRAVAQTIKFTTGNRDTYDIFVNIQISWKLSNPIDVTVIESTNNATSDIYTGFKLLRLFQDCGRNHREPKANGVRIRILFVGLRTFYVFSRIKRSTIMHIAGQRVYNSKL